MPRSWSETDDEFSITGSRWMVDMASACCLVLDGSATFVRGWRAFRQRRRISMNISLAPLRRRVNLCRAHAGLSGKGARADWTEVKASSRQWVGIGYLTCFTRRGEWFLTAPENCWRVVRTFGSDGTALLWLASKGTIYVVRGFIIT